jgi:hypothetical protein
MDEAMAVDEEPMDAQIAFMGGEEAMWEEKEKRRKIKRTSRNAQ